MTKERVLLLARLCLVGFFVNCQPSEPYLTKYLVDNKGISKEVVDDVLWPIDSLALALALIPAGILAELIGYRKVIFGGLLFREATRLILLFGEGVPLMATTQGTYAAAIAAHTVYFAYAYRAVPPDLYVSATGAMHAAYHFGNVIGALLGQACMSWITTDMVVLFYMSFFFTTLGLLSFVFLFPHPVRGRHRTALLLAENADEDPPTLEESPTLLSLWRERGGVRGTLRLLADVYASSSFTVAAWSAWWVLAYGAHTILSDYYQTAFYSRDKDGNFGFLEACMEVGRSVGALTPALIASCCTRSLTASSHVVMIVLGCIFAGAGNLLSLSVASNAGAYLLTVVGVYIFGLQYATACAAIASSLTCNFYAVVFTMNTFASLILSAVLLRIGSAVHTSLEGYYWISSGQQFCCAAVILAALAVRMRGARPASADMINGGFASGVLPG